MTQFQFDVICSLIQNGAPALANELIGALSAVIKEANAVVEENAALKAEVKRLSSEPCDDCKCVDGKCCEDK
jgi:hypothetical protein